MTLKKDAMIAVSLAGIVLILAIGSTKRESSRGSTSRASFERATQNADLLRTYVEFMSSRTERPADESELRAASARKFVRNLHRNGGLLSPMDLMRASAILASSTDPSDLTLSHELAVEALAQGVRSARKIVLEAEDRLLLSAGRPQRYGTQKSWLGKELPVAPVPFTSELTPKDQNILRTGGPPAIKAND